MAEIGDFPSWCKAAVEHVPIEEARAVPCFSVAAQCFQVWWGLDPGTIPTRQQLDPVRFGARLLPYLSLIDVLDGGADYRWRLCGEAASQVMGLSLAGRKLSDVEKCLGDGVLFRLALNDVVKQGEPLFYVLRHRSLQGCVKRTYGVLLPLRDAHPSLAHGRPRPHHILGACDWTTGE